MVFMVLQNPYASKSQEFISSISMFGCSFSHLPWCLIVIKKILVDNMIKRVGSIRACLEALLSPFRSTKKRFRLPPRRPLKGCPSLISAANGRRFRLILATLTRRRFLVSA
jgi:hypothetical protein